jgi:TRAP transporter TAXI family solute receptor
VRRIACYAAMLGAALMVFSAPGAAQQPPFAQIKRPVAATPPQLPSAARYVALRDKLNQNTVTVISGNPNGTYLYLAYDMSAVLDNGDELRVLPVIGKGGYQNVMDVLHLRGVDLCITQSNIMTYLKKTGEMGPNIENRLAFITRLYNEEMHVLAGAGITSIQELNGKKVNFSDVGSGTQFSARLIFELLKIRIQEVNVGQADGYEKVRSGEIAATILIAGKPTGAFGKFKMEPGMTLLPVPYTEALEQDYLPAKLTNDDYPNLIPKGSSVDTVAIPSVLAVYNWPRESDRFRRVSRFIDYYFDRFKNFHAAPYHPKWKSINLAAKVPGWTRYWVAEEKLKQMAAQVATQGTRDIAVDTQLVRQQAARAAPNNAAEQERLFQQFLEWTKSQGKQ